MKIAHFWTRGTGEASASDGRLIRVVARGWSDETPEMAARVARDVATRLAQKIASGDRTKGGYLYGDRPLPEPIIREFAGPQFPRALITRNSYGALVMNAQELMFIDIDREDGHHNAQDLFSGLKSLFGGRANTPPANPVLEQIRRVAEANSLSGRVYKTAAGYRVAITNAAYQPATPNSESLLRQFGADPLYVRLCQVQQSFRARLTPKPWRCDVPTPPVSFPYESPSEQARFREWESRYTAASANYATCHFVTSFGGGRVAAEFEDLLQHHDDVTKAGSQLPLA